MAPFPITLLLVPYRPAVFSATAVNEGASLKKATLNHVLVSALGG